jgi:hypothetical protein
MTTQDGIGPLGAFGFHVTEVGGGHYRIYSNPTTVDGIYTVLVNANDPWGQQFNLLWEVDPAPVVPGPVYITPGNRTTLRELRAMLARTAGDYLELEATHDSPANQIRDAFTLVENTDHFRGAEIVCRQGNRLNVGQKRKITSSSYENYMVETLIPFPAPIVAGDRFEVFNFNGRNASRIRQYDDAINDAIRNAWPQNREKMYVEPIETYSRVSGIAIPDEMTHIYAIHSNLVTDGWIDIMPARSPNDVGWWADRSTRTLWLAGGYGYDSDGKFLRIYGYGRPPVLVNDDDTTATDVEWIIETASGSLLTGRLDQATFPIGQSRANRADQLRAKMAIPSEPNTVSL